MAKRTARRAVTFIAVVTAIMGMLVTLTVSYLHRVRVEARTEAVEGSMAFARSLESGIDRDVARIDMGLADLVDELDTMMAAGRLEAGEVRKNLDRVMARLPEVYAIRVSDAAGIIRFGADVDPSTRISIADRAYFQRLRDDASVGFALSRLIVGRVTGKLVVNIARRLVRPDGEFAGIVWASLPVESLVAGFSSRRLGETGEIALLGAGDEIILRWPSDMAPPVESTYAETEARLMANAAALRIPATLLSGDGGERAVQGGEGNLVLDGGIWAIARSDENPIAVVVKAEEGVYLGGYRRSLCWVAAGLAAGLVASVLLALLLVDRIRRREIHTESILAEKATAQGYLDIAQIMIGVLDPAGRILLLNRWGCSMLGLDERETVGKDWFELCVPHEEREARRAAFASMLRSTVANARPESRLLRKDGEVIFVSMKGVATRTPEGATTGFLFSGEDVTDYRRAREREALVRDALELMAAGAGLEAVLARMAIGIEQSFPGDLCMIAVRASDSAASARASSPGLPDGLFEKVAALKGGLPGQALGRGEAVFLEDTDPDLDLAGFGRAHGIPQVRSVWAGPIIADQGAVMGTLAVFRTRNDPPGAAESALFKGAVEGLRNAIERRRALDALRESERRYRSIFDLSAVSIWEEDVSALREHLALLGIAGVEGLDAKADSDPGFVTAAMSLVNVLDCNQATLDLYGAARKEELLGPLGRTIDQGTSEDFRRILAALVEGRSTFHMETKARDLSGRVFDVSLFVYIPPEYSPWQSVLVSVLDISDRVRAERELERAVREREVLLRELQHRVKNTLLLVSSLLSLDEGRIADEETRQVLAEAQGRIVAMSAVYEKLYRSEDLAAVELSTYVEELVRGILGDRAGPAGVELALDLPAVKLDTKRAISMGLIINELVTNTLKYAFPGEGKGKLRVSMEPRGEKLLLAVADDGPGLPEGFDPARTSSLGTQLVLLLAGQLGGTVRWISGKGTRVELAFPLAQGSA